MESVVVDAVLASKLTQSQSGVQICDASGRIIGSFYRNEDLSDWEPTEPFLSDEELTSRENSGSKRYSISEILARLEKL